MPLRILETDRTSSVFKGLAILLALAALAGCLAVPAAARTRKGDKFLAQGKERAARKDWDGALDFFQKALAEDPGDPGYELEVHQARFQASEAHVQEGLKLRKAGSLAPALLEFEKAFGIDPSSSVAEQEIRTTTQMIEREKKKGADSDTRSLTPSQLAKRDTQEKIDSMLPVPELRPLNAQPINLKMNSQPTKILFETVGKLAGINVLFDSEFKENNKQSIELTGATLYEALDYLAVISKAFWKPLSANTIFVAQDNTTKRRDYEEQVMKVFYLTNVTTPQELQEIVTAVRSVADIQRLFVYNAQNAIIARGEETGSRHQTFLSVPRRREGVCDTEVVARVSPPAGELDRERDRTRGWGHPRYNLPARSTVCQLLCRAPGGNSTRDFYPLPRIFLPGRKNWRNKNMSEHLIVYTEREEGPVSGLDEELIRQNGGTIRYGKAVDGRDRVRLAEAGGGHRGGWHAADARIPCRPAKPERRCAPRNRRGQRGS